MSRGRELLRRQFVDGRLDPEADRELQALLRASAELRAEYARWVELERTIEGRDVSQAQIERLLARGAPAPQSDDSSSAPPAPSRLRGAGVAAVLFVAAAAAVLLTVSPPSPGPTARSGGGASGRLAWITVFQAGAEDAPLRRVDEAARADAPFAFAYSNLADSPYRYLAIAGRDAAGGVRWFHPAYTDASQRPQSVTIEAGVADVELKELVGFDLPPGRLEVCALFSTTPLDVHSLDARLESGAPWPTTAGLDCHTLRVAAPP